MNKHSKIIINALAAAAACFLAMGFSSCTSEEMEASLSYSPTSVSVSSTGGSFEIALSATVSYSVSVSGDWLWPSSNDLYWLYGCGYFCRVPGNAVLEFTAEANTSSSSRTTTIKITAGDLSATVSVTQAGADGSGDEDSGDSSDDSGDGSYDVSGTLNGYEYVDLGLSVNWATCNIGADSPEDYGNYYAWGETETKSSYTSSNSVTYGVSMSDIAGNAYYDAATANWGSTWRMPTYSEIGELISNCTWTWTTLNSVNGYEVTGTNGNSIFLPAAGYCYGSILYLAGSTGYYLSSTPYTSDTNYFSYSLYLYIGLVSRDNQYRYHGLSVRPVFSDDSGGDSGDYDASGTINGYEYVDLGLSVMWATCNIGADDPEDYGNYYAWGETETKSTYTSSNSVTYGVSMSDFTGNAEYDAATANWGSPWRMPTRAEIYELFEGCTWTWTTLNGVKNGLKVTGTNENSIFLPAAGYRSSSRLYDTGSRGSYWSSTPDTSDTDFAYGLDFASGSVGRDYYDYRDDGLSVRPVFGGSSGDSSDGDSSLSVSPTSVSVAAAGESFTVSVTCDTDYSVDVSDTWLTLNSNSSGTLSFTADANTSGSSRTATITVTAGDLSETVTVTQAGISLSVSPTTVSVAAAGGTFSITVTCNVSSYSYSSSVSWLTLDSSSGDVYTYTASENTSTSSRTGTITVTAGAVSVTVTIIQGVVASGTINGYAYVDLGVSVMWATCNIGADSPEDYGNYYAWGETETKDSYTSYNSVTYGVEMDDFSGNAEYDAATANWGSPWRMPTDSELTELRTSCTWTWTTMNDVNGYEVTGTNGNSIFLPAAGNRNSSSLNNAGSNGNYWSSTPNTSNTNNAYNLNFNSSNVNRNNNNRYNGQSVRPVSELTSLPGLPARHFLPLMQVSEINMPLHRAAGKDKK